MRGLGWQSGSRYEKRLKEGGYYERKAKYTYEELIEDDAQKDLMDKEYKELLLMRIGRPPL
jgi:hypothetical protein